MKRAIIIDVSQTIHVKTMETVCMMFASHSESLSIQIMLVCPVSQHAGMFVKMHVLNRVAATNFDVF